MFIDTLTLSIGGVAGLSLACTVACGVLVLSVKQRLTAVESQGGPGGNDCADDYESLAARVSSIQNSITVLQSGMAGLQDTVTATKLLDEDREDGFALQRSLNEPERHKPSFKAEWETTTPVNLNRRGQIIRMHRRGESIAAIALTVGISQGEVKLTLRMQELHSERPDKEISLDRL
jgi:hypothetical protein